MAVIFLYDVSAGRQICLIFAFFYFSDTKWDYKRTIRWPA